MLPSLTTVLLVALLSRISAQDFHEERKTERKLRAKTVAANIHDGQGEKVTKSNNSSIISSLCSPKEHFSSRKCSP